MKISFITTVFNEEKTIEKFLHSLIIQTKQPDEIIIVDGDSKDKTFSIISNVKYPISNVKLKVYKKRGNRSVGRNEAIKKATGDIIVCSDSGNVLDKKWIENITKPFGLAQGKPFKNVDVVAGYYKGLAKNVFQKCLIPFVLVMPDKVDPDTFLPATRSVAFTKSIWKKAGGFNKKYAHNEDYVFAHTLRKIGAKIVFAKDAVVNWIPRSSYKEAFVMFFRFALGDAEAGIWRTNVLLLFARYFVGFYFLFLSLLYRSFAPITIIAFAFILYIFWAIKKNYRYVQNKEAYTILPFIQVTADAAVLSGTIVGLVKKITHINYFSYIKNNKFLFFILFIYVSSMLVILRSGIPNQNHPYPYNMDEWHQLEAVANTFRYGTPNTAGSANGTMFHFMLSGFYLIPFVFLNIINPFSLHIDNLLMRERIFEVLRLQTILFGVLSILTLYKVAELIKVSRKLVITLFVFTPIWFALSNFFKYDIALIFWILLSLLYILKFAAKPNSRNFMIAAIPAALTLAVKVSAMPMFLIYVFSYFWFFPKWKKHIKVLFAGISIFIAIVILFGVPDTLFGKGNVIDYFLENVMRAPGTSSDYNLGMNPLLYMFSVHYPMIFGHAFISLFIFVTLVGLFLLGKGNIEEYKHLKKIVFLIFSFLIFLLSLIPLQMFGGVNRALVLLPFFVLIIGLIYKHVSNMMKKKLLLKLIFVVVIFFQIMESVALLQIKIMKSPPEKSSIWLKQHIQRGETIGIENIPIYQQPADFIVKEFYYKQSNLGKNNQFAYKIVDADTKVLPSIIVVSNDEIEKQFVKISEKNRLTDRLTKEKYKKVAVFYPELSLFKVFNDTSEYYLYAWLVGTSYNISIYEKK